MRRLTKQLLSLIIIMAITWQAQSQEPEIPETDRRQELEAMTEKLDHEPDDDYDLEALENYNHHPLDLNTAEEKDLFNFQFLTRFQIDNFLQYRSLLGKFIDLHELQAIPGWDIYTIRSILSFVIIDESK